MKKMTSAASDTRVSASATASTLVSRLGVPPTRDAPLLSTVALCGPFRGAAFVPLRGASGWLAVGATTNCAPVFRLSRFLVGD